LPSPPWRPSPVAVSLLLILRLPTRGAEAGTEIDRVTDEIRGLGRSNWRIPPDRRLEPHHDRAREPRPDAVREHPRSRPGAQQGVLLPRPPGQRQRRSTKIQMRARLSGVQGWRQNRHDHHQSRVHTLTSIACRRSSAPSLRLCRPVGAALASTP
jgi:hypothetical protein